MQSEAVVNLMTEAKSAAVNKEAELSNKEEANYNTEPVVRPTVSILLLLCKRGLINAKCLRTPQC